LPKEEHFHSSCPKTERFQTIQRHHAIFILPRGALEVPISRLEKIRLDANALLVETADLPERRYVFVFGGSSRVLESQWPIRCDNVAFFGKSKERGYLVICGRYALSSCEAEIMESNSGILWTP
jgi:hypothetical protein